MTKQTYEDIMIAIEELEFTARDIDTIAYVPLKDIEVEAHEAWVELNDTINALYRIMKEYKHLESE